MRESVRRCLSVLLVVAVVTTGTFAFVNFDQGPRELNRYAGVQKAEAIACGGVCLGAGIAAGIAVGYAANEYLASDSSELTSVDAAETRLEVWETAATTDQNQRQLLSAMDNYGQDGSSIALMEAKNAYIRAVENGSAEAVATSEAKQAANDWYSARMVQVLDEWTISLEAFDNERAAVSNDANLSEGGVFSYRSIYAVEDVRTVSTTLMNGSSHDVAAIHQQSGGSVSYNTHPAYKVESSSTYLSTGYKNFSVTVNAFGDGDYDDQIFTNASRHREVLHQLETSRQGTLTEIENFINTTYDRVQSGEINSTDLVDPYLRARDYSPESEYGTWTLSTLQSLGVNSPTDLKDVKEMVVSYEGTETRGVLLSDGLPEGGQFEVGTTYNTSNLAGKQMLMSDGTTTELSGEFSITDVIGTDGESTGQQAVGYNEIEYQTANLTEYKALMEDLKERQAQIEARQQALRNGSGGGGDGWPDLGGLPFGGMGVAAGAIALLGLAVIGGRRN